ncbi:MAG: UrcA family protein [Lysobacterales bacterium]|nr:MAG: UrcA family protein [Xanthomonadales bacterium]
MKTFIASCFVGVVLSTLVMAKASAASDIPRHERKATVYVGDLDLATERDARVLYERIDYAARSICAAEDRSFDSKKRPHGRQCVEAAITDAVERANALVLTAIHLQRRGRLAGL